MTTATNPEWPAWAILVVPAVLLPVLLFAPYVLVGALALAVFPHCLLLGRPRVWVRPGAPIGPPQSDTARRRMAWAALSEFYLDTDLNASDYHRIAERLRESRYSRGELEQILYLELHYLLVWNLLSVAGEWALFDLEWLQWQVTSRRRRHNRRRRVLFGARAVENHWAEVQRLLAGPAPGQWEGGLP